MVKKCTDSIFHVIQQLPCNVQASRVLCDARTFSFPKSDPFVQTMILCRISRPPCIVWVHTIGWTMYQWRNRSRWWQPFHTGRSLRNVPPCSRQTVCCEQREIFEQRENLHFGLIIRCQMHVYQNGNQKNHESIVYFPKHQWYATRMNGDKDTTGGNIWPKIAIFVAAAIRFSAFVWIILFSSFVTPGISLDVNIKCYQIISVSVGGPIHHSLSFTISCSSFKSEWYRSLLINRCP